MSITIDVAGSVIPTDATAIKSLRADATLLFGLGPAWLAILDLTLGTVPPQFVAGDATYTGPAVSFPLGPVTFGLQANAGVSLALHTSGVLTTFQNGLEQPVQQTIAVPADVAYLALTLHCNISGNASSAYSGGRLPASPPSSTRPEPTPSLSTKPSRPPPPFARRLPLSSSRLCCPCIKIRSAI